MYYLVYLSAATQWLNETELLKILSVSRINNSRNHLSGVLLYGNGTFIQLLEGDREQVRETFDRISNDDRYKGITQVANGELVERNFPSWSMGFKSVDSLSLNQFKGFLDSSNKDNYIAAKLLKSFIRTEKMSF
jgi:Sensors of blue-light using FAD